SRSSPAMARHQECIAIEVEGAEVGRVFPRGGRIFIEYLFVHLRPRYAFTSFICSSSANASLRFIFTLHISKVSFIALCISAPFALLYSGSEANRSINAAHILG